MSWITNFSSLYASYDDGNTWVRKEEVTLLHVPRKMALWGSYNVYLMSVDVIVDNE